MLQLWTSFNKFYFSSPSSSFSYFHYRRIHKFCANNKWKLTLSTFVFAWNQFFFHKSKNGIVDERNHAKNETIEKCLAVSICSYFKYALDIYAICSIAIIYSEQVQAKIYLKTHTPHNYTRFSSFVV